MKNAVPVVAIDPEAGGSKLKRQTQTLGWPLCFVANRLEQPPLGDALDYLLGRRSARRGWGVRRSGGFWPRVDRVASCSRTLAHRVSVAGGITERRPRIEAR